jgi:arginine exporter protein ArgO
MILMTGLTGAGLAGAGAGIGVAMPLGAVGVLLVQEAIAVGWRAAAGGALGVALVDLTYSVLALVAGAGLTRALHGYEPAVQIGGAVILVAVAIRGVLGLRRSASRANGSPSPTSGLSPAPTSAPSAWRVTGRFVALTAINPLTAVYFVALAAGAGDSVHGPERGVAFAAGVFAASLSWQLVLVTVGAVAGERLGERARLGTGLLGYLVVLGYAARLAAGAG